MALQFVLGSAGSGKSGYVFRKTVKEAQKNLKKNYYVVVPEQFTMQTQREPCSVTGKKQYYEYRCGQLPATGISYFRRIRKDEYGSFRGDREKPCIA